MGLEATAPLREIIRQERTRSAALRDAQERTLVDMQAHDLETYARLSLEQPVAVVVELRPARSRLEVAKLLVWGLLGINGKETLWNGSRSSRSSEKFSR